MLKFLILLFICISIKLHAQQAKELKILDFKNGKSIEDVLCIAENSNAVLGFSNENGILRLPLNYDRLRFHHLDYYDTIFKYHNISDTIYLKPKKEKLPEVTVSSNLPKPKVHFKNIFDRSAQKFEASKADTQFFTYRETRRINKDSIYFSIPILSGSQIDGAYANTKINFLRYHPIEVYLSADRDSIKKTLEKEILVYFRLMTSLVYPKFHGAFFFLSHDVRRIINENNLLFIISDSKKDASSRDYWLFEVNKRSGLITRVNRKALRTKKGEKIHSLSNQVYNYRDSSYALQSAYYYKKFAKHGETTKLERARISRVNVADFNPADSAAYNWPNFANINNFLNGKGVKVKRP